MTKIWTDDPAGLSTNLAAIGEPNVGTALNPLGDVFARSVTADSISGDPTLPNNDFLEATVAAGGSTAGLLKLDATDNTVLNAITGKVIKLSVNGTSVATVDSNSIDAPAFNLTDGSDKNYSLAAYGSGTVYSFTNAQAAIAFGTTSPSVTINKAGTYKIRAKVNVKYVGATFAAVRLLTLKLRRTNNTAADLTNGSTVLATDIITTLTYTMGVYELPEVIYQTTSTGTSITDVVTIFGGLDTAPTAGSLDAMEASIVVERYTAP